MTVKIIGDDSMQRLQATVNREVAPHKRLTALGSHHIVKLFGSSFRIRQVTHLAYMYTEYAPFGDLYEFIHAVRRTPG